MCLLIRVRGGERASERAGEEAGRGAEAGAGTAAGALGSPAPRPPPSLREKRRRGSDCGVDELCTSRNAILIPFPEQVCISLRSLPEAHRSPPHHAWEPSALPGRKYASRVPARGPWVAARCPGHCRERPFKELFGDGEGEVCRVRCTFETRRLPERRTRAPHAAQHALGAVGPAGDEPGSPLPSGSEPGRSSSSSSPSSPSSAPFPFPSCRLCQPAPSASRRSAPPAGPDAHPY